MNCANYAELLKIFKSVTKKRWIEGVIDNNSDVGLTFERELDKDPDSMYFPDFRNIEIKCRQRYSHYPIGLFNLAFDGPSLYQTNLILEKYGIPDYKYSDKKILITKLSFKKLTLVNNDYFFKLKINYQEEKIFLEVYNSDGFLIDTESYIDFDTLKKRVELKLSNVAVIHASKKMINDKRHFRYYELNIYKLRSFDRFLEMLENDDINIALICRVTRSGEKEGKQRNKGLIFEIAQEKLESLFDLVLHYNTDEKWNY